MITLEDSIEINTTPEKIWEFFANLEKTTRLGIPKIIFYSDGLKEDH